MPVVIAASLVVAPPDPIPPDPGPQPALLTAPILGGVTLPRPNASSRTTEAVEESLTLANGAERIYIRGFRYVYALQWTSMRWDSYADLESAVALRYGTLPLVWIDGTATTVRVTPDGRPAQEPKAGTWPPRYAASLTLRETGIRDPMSGVLTP